MGRNAQIWDFFFYISQDMVVYINVCGLGRCLHIHLFYLQYKRSDLTLEHDMTVITGFISVPLYICSCIRPGVCVYMPFFTDAVGSD